VEPRNLSLREARALAAGRVLPPPIAIAFKPSIAVPTGGYPVDLVDEFGAAPVRVLLERFAAEVAAVGSFALTEPRECRCRPAGLFRHLVPVQASGLPFGVERSRKGERVKASSDRSWAGTCRSFTLRLVDGSVHSAQFKFR
jgi:hypothetical protein